MTIRTYGLSGSGIDVDAMVESLMKARRVSYDNLYKQKTQLEWKKADYYEMYTAIKDFRSNAVFNTKLQSTTLAKKASSSSESIASVTANADAANVSHDITVHQLADGVKKTSSAAISGTDKTTLATQFGISGTFEITIKNGTASKTLTVDSAKSIYEFVGQINNAGINVKANYDATLDRFFLYTTNTGSGASLELTDAAVDGGNFLADKLKLDTTTATGQDAIFALDGVGSTTDIDDENNLTMSSNSFTISGVTYNLKATGTVKATVSSDTDKIVASVKSFVEAYNSMLEKINNKVSETKYSDYLPLTDAEKEELKDTQITAWEEKAKSGLLRHDSILQNLVSSMRSNFSTPVSGLTGKYTSASSLGITTGSYTEGGKLYLDEAKLKAALEDDPDIVNKIFGTDSDSSNGDGIAVRLYDTLKSTMDRIYTVAGATSSVSSDTKSSLAIQINNYTKRMADMNTRLADIEARYYKQFDALETALNRLNNQSSWLLQQFSST